MWHPTRVRSLWLQIFCGGALIFLLFPLIRLSFATAQYTIPDGILMLGGGFPNREVFTAQFAQQHPDLPVWVSTGAPEKPTRRVFAMADIAPERLHLDYRAVDTLTNFTSLVSTWEDQDIHHLYVITSAFHLPRAQAIATIVLGSRGIAFTPVAVPNPSSQREESVIHIARDVLRAYGWLLTGRTGATFTLWVHPERRTLSTVTP